MLTVAQIGPAIQAQFSNSDGSTTGLSFLFLGFGIAALLKIAQGSSTVAMITTSAMLATMNVNTELLGFDPVYLATSIGAGSLIGSWMNDSGFWVIGKMSGMTEGETLKYVTPMTALMGVAGFVIVLLGVQFFPMV